VAVTLHVQEVEIGESRAIPETLRVFVQGKDAAGIGERKRFQQDAPDHREHHRRGPDAQRQCHQRHHGESRPLAQRAHRVAQVVEQILHPARAPRVAGAFRHLRSSSEGQARLPPRFHRVGSLGDQVLRERIQMEANFFFQLLVHSLPVHQALQPVHSELSADSFKIRPTAPASRCQLAVSASRCARPLAVSL
jgi:hypothetical protein